MAKKTVGKSASSKATVSHFFPQPNYLFKLSPVELIFEALSSSYLFPNLNTIQFWLVHQAQDRAKNEEQSNLQAEDLLKSMVYPIFIGYLVNSQLRN